MEKRCNLASAKTGSKERTRLAFEIKVVDDADKANLKIDRLDFQAPILGLKVGRELQVSLPVLKASTDIKQGQELAIYFAKAKVESKRKAKDVALDAAPAAKKAKESKAGKTGPAKQSKKGDKK